MLWICRARSCAYEEHTLAVPRYCPWCGEDLIPSCSSCRGALDLAHGRCTSCGLPAASCGQVTHNAGPSGSRAVEPCQLGLGDYQ